MTNTAVVVGASGIVGSAAAGLLTRRGWSVYGLARRPAEQPGMMPIAVDLRNADGTGAALSGLRPDAVFITTWLRQDSEAENIQVNAGMVRNLLDGLRPGGTTRHVALVTGLKHYLGPFEAYGKGVLPQTPVREDQARLDVENFYYAQEDELFAAADRDGFGWSVHRPHTVIGKAVGNAMNMGTTLAVYATLCRETGQPFRFPGSATQWHGLTDMTDAGLLAKHLLWAATTPAARNEAFNVVNGDVFRWSWMWGKIAAWFGLTPAPFDGVAMPLEQQMRDAGRSGARSPSGKGSPSLTSPGSRHPGIPMRIWGDRSRSSPIWARVGGSASRTISRRMMRSSICSSGCVPTV